MKPIWKSLTLWSAIIALVGVILSQLAAGASVVGVASDPGVQAAIGDVLSALGFVGVVAGRLRVGDLAVRPTSSPVSPPDERGMARLDVVLTLAAVASVIALLFAAMTSSGCGTVRIDSPEPVALSVDSGPPCAIVAQDHAGETVLSFTAPGTCDPQVSRRWLCRRWRAALGPGEVQPLACAGVQP